MGKAASKHYAYNPLPWPQALEAFGLIDQVRDQTRVPLQLPRARGCLRMRGDCWDGRGAACNLALRNACFSQSTEHASHCPDARRCP